MGCGDCTACCTLFPIDVIEKPINTHCQYCDNGCLIYDSKPLTCSEFNCAYLQSDNAPKELRPDKCGIIFTKKTYRIFTGALMPEAEITDIARAQINSFNDQGYSVVLLSLEEKKPLLMLSKGHDHKFIMSEYREAISGNVQH